MRKSALIVIMIFCSLLAQMVNAKGGHEFCLGARQHVDHSTYTELPFNDGDLSYGIAYEYHEGQAYWQIALDYAPDITGTNFVDSVLTPQLNLIFEDRAWRGGLGILTSYIVSDDDDDWTDIYWQFLFGIHLGMSKNIQLDVFAYYPFEGWAEIGEFDGKDIEFGGWLHFPF